MKRILLTPEKRHIIFCVECDEKADWMCVDFPTPDEKYPTSRCLCNACASEYDTSVPEECPPFIEPAEYHKKEARKKGTLKEADWGNEQEKLIAELAAIGEAVRDIYPSFKPGQPFRHLTNSIVDDLVALLSLERSEIANIKMNPENEVCWICGEDEPDCTCNGHFVSAHDDIIRTRLGRCDRVFEWLTQNPTAK